MLKILKGEEKMNIISYEDYLYDIISEIEENELLSIHNEYCMENGSYDCIVDKNSDEFLEMNFSSLRDLARAICFGKYKYNDPYVRINVYGNIESYSSLNRVLEEVLDKDSIVDYMVNKEEKKDEWEELIYNEIEEASINDLAKFIVKCKDNCINEVVKNVIFYRIRNLEYDDIIDILLACKNNRDYSDIELEVEEEAVILLESKDIVEVIKLYDTLKNKKDERSILAKKVIDYSIL